MIKNNRSPLRWIAKMFKGQRLNMAILIVANALFSILSILFAFAIKGIIDNAVLSQTTGQSYGIVLFAIILGVIIILQFVFRFLINGLTEHIRAKLEMKYKSHIFSQILSKKYDKINGYHSGELMNRLTSDVSIVSDGVTNILPNIVAATVRLVCAIVALVILDWVFAVAFVVAGVLVFLVMSLLRGKLKNLHRKGQETDGKVRSFMQESIENLLAVKVFAVNGKVEEQSDNLQEENFKIKMKRKNYAVLGFATYNFIFSAGYIFALIYGCFAIINLPNGYGTLSAILQLVNNVQVPFMSFSNVLPKYYAMIVSTERLMEIENIQNEPTCKQLEPKSLYQKMNGISIEDVQFAYDRDVVLKDANLYVKKGDFVVISGTSGIGKSTLIKLMLGVYPLEKGRIELDCEKECVELSPNTRSLFSYVPQGNMLFSGSLRDNVTFIKSDATDVEIERALDISCASDFIKDLPMGLDTIVGENGIGLSEGQIQRIAIARAVLVDAPIILLDEATSALDEETERRVLNNFSKLEDITLIIISHKKAAQDICNRKIKIKSKRIIEE